MDEQLSPLDIHLTAKIGSVHRDSYSLSPCRVSLPDQRTLFSFSSPSFPAPRLKSENNSEELCQPSGCRNGGIFNQSRSYLFIGRWRSNEQKSDYPSRDMIIILLSSVGIWGRCFDWKHPLMWVNRARGLPGTCCWFFLCLIDLDERWPSENF